MFRGILYFNDNPVFQGNFYARIEHLKQFGYY